MGHYAVAFEAQRIGTAALIAGNTCASSDNLAQAYIDKQGMKDNAFHRVGHGVGIMFHEPPWIEAGDQTILEPGMIASSEPSITIPDFAGYRIADTVLVTANGAGQPDEVSAGSEEIVIG